MTHTALDGRVVVNGIVHYAEDARWWKFEVLDFDMVPTPATNPLPESSALPAPALRNGFWKRLLPRFHQQALATAAAQAPAPPTTSLVELLRTAQIDDGRRIIDDETELREILGISTDLRVTSLNLSMQWLALAIAVFALVVGAIAAWAAIKALPSSSAVPSTQVSTEAKASASSIQS